MYKLFINNIQIGNFTTMKFMFNSALNCSVIKNGVKSIVWKGNSCFVRTYDVDVKTLDNN